MGTLASASSESVLNILDRNRFTFSAEIIPPRNGTDFETVFNVVDQLRTSGFDFISVTHGAGGSLRGGTMPIAHYAQNAAKVTAIAHLTCRGVSREDLENILIDHHYFGIHNVLALRGDSPDGIGVPFTPAKNGYSYAHELVTQMHKMNQGEYLSRPGFDKDPDKRTGIKTSFTIGVASYPEDSIDTRLQYLKMKKDAGAHFSITQMIFDIDLFAEFYAEVVDAWGHDFPVLPGIRIPNSWKMLDRMVTKFQIRIPRALQKAMRAAENKGADAMKNVGQEWALEFISELYKMGIKGVHFFIMSDAPGAQTVREKFIESGKLNA